MQIRKAREIWATFQTNKRYTFVNLPSPYALRGIAAPNLVVSSNEDARAVSNVSPSALVFNGVCECTIMFTSGLKRPIIQFAMIVHLLRKVCQNLTSTSIWRCQHTSVSKLYIKFTNTSSKSNDDFVFGNCRNKTFSFFRSSSEAG